VSAETTDGKSGKPTLVRQASYGESVWGELLGKTLTMAIGVQRQVMADVKESLKAGQQPDISLLMKKAKLAVEAFVEDNRKLYEKIWDKYDENGDGELSKEECAKMTKESLLMQKKKLPLVMAGILDESIKITKELIQEMGGGDEDISQIESMFKEVKSTINIESGKIMDGFLADSENMAAQLWTLMDVNKDGRVSKQEFLDNYTSAFQQMFNMNQLLQKFNIPI